MNSLTLYHHPLSVCSMKVRLALEEKGLVWSDRVIDIVGEQEQLEPWYVKLNPQGVIPTLEFNNGKTEVITDSALIIRFIASLPEGHSIVPVDEGHRQLMEKLIDLADSVDLQILSYARHPSVERSENILNARIQKSLALADNHPELKSNYLACAERSETNKKFRFDKKHIEQVELKALGSIAFAEKQLTDNTFLLGDAYSLADVIWTVVLSRLDLLGYPEWVAGDKFPQLAKYYQRAQSRASFTRAQVQNEWWDK